jgi:holo-[acyl-carrier protein] synthase
VRGARVGVDLVDVADFRARFDGREDVLRGVFTGAELDYCRSRPAVWSHLAARLAAKEAALKALGSGLAGTMTWHDIEVTRDAVGAPGLAFRGAAAETLARAGLSPGALSLSHTDGHAVAVVLLVAG